MVLLLVEDMLCVYVICVYTLERMFLQTVWGNCWREKAVEVREELLYFVVCGRQA